VRERVADRAARRADESIGGEGVIARIADNAFDNPAMSGGLVVMALTAAAIVSNAMFLQSGRHPEPLFMTRPAASLDLPKTPAPVPMPRTRANQPSAIATPPLARAAPTPAVQAAVPDAKLVADLQRSLARKGFYAGVVDGITGSRTRAAISAYEKTVGLAATGEPTAGLLDSIKIAAAKPAPTPVPPPPAVAAAPSPIPAPAPVPFVGARPAPVLALPQAPIVPAKPAPILAPPPAPIAAAKLEPTSAPPPPVAAAKPDAAEIEHARYLTVQGALNQIGYGPLKVDGGASAETENAIRRFELDNGLPINGKADSAVVNRLIAIGAMKPT
jgi:peptidoglycan hydrolase-like protein with peptidoglycan-binding domain